MITIYTNMQQSDDRFVLNNDAYFNIITSTLPLDEADRKLIKRIDNAIVIDNVKIQSNYGIGNITDLSTGCKTVLNIKKNPDKIFCIDECGPNALTEIFKLDKTFVCMTFPQNFDWSKCCTICFNADHTKIANNEIEFVKIWRELREA